MITLTSEQNPHIKNVVKLLEKSKERKSQQLFVVEGIQENTFALAHHYEPTAFFLHENIVNNQIKIPYISNTFLVNAKVYDKIAYRKSTEGIVGIYKIPKTNFSNILSQTNPKIIALDSIEKPGNLGAILRSAEAFGINAIVLLNEKVDLYNPNVIRSSVGTVFAIPVFSFSYEDFYDVIKTQKFQLITTFMDEKSIALQQIDFTQKTILLFGTENSGISRYWLNKMNQNALIPTVGTIDSLNVSNAVAIALYEWSRK